MRKWTLLGLVLIVSVSCVACMGTPSSGTGDKDSEKETNSQQNSETEKNTGSELVSGSESDTEPESSTEVVDEKLTWFATKFFNSQNPRTMANQFLTCLYNSPREIEMDEVFYNGTMGEGTSSGEMTPEEREELAKLVDVNLDIVKISVEDIDAILETYIGAKSTSFTKENFQGMVYLEEYQAYYTSKGDTNAMCPTFLECKDNGDGTYTLIYTSSSYYEPDQKFAVKLKAVGETYQIISNKLVE